MKYVKSFSAYWANMLVMVPLVIVVTIWNAAKSLTLGVFGAFLCALVGINLKSLGTHGIAKEASGNMEKLKSTLKIQIADAVDSPDRFKYYNQVLSSMHIVQQYLKNKYDLTMKD